MKVSKKNIRFFLSFINFRLPVINLRLSLLQSFLWFSLIIPLIIILVIFLTLFNTGCTNLISGGFNISEKSADDINSENEKTEGSQGSENAAASEEIKEENAEPKQGSNENETVESKSEETSISDEGDITINVYYANSTAEYLVGEARTLSGSGKYVDAIFEMMKDPIDSSLIKLIPETTKINGIKVEENTAKVDLSQNFIDDRFIGDAADILLVYSIVNTLTEFSEVDSVEFYIDGQKLDILGQLDVGEPLFRRSDLIKS